VIKLGKRLFARLFFFALLFGLVLGALQHISAALQLVTFINGGKGGEREKKEFCAENEYVKRNIALIEISPQPL
jgi:hypothetical protein